MHILLYLYSIGLGCHFIDVCRMMCRKLCLKINNTNYVSFNTKNTQISMKYGGYVQESPLPCSSVDHIKHSIIKY